MDSRNGLDSPSASDGDIDGATAGHEGTGSEPPILLAPAADGPWVDVRQETWVGHLPTDVVSAEWQLDSKSLRLVVTASGVTGIDLSNMPLVNLSITVQGASWNAGTSVLPPNVLVKLPQSVRNMTATVSPGRHCKIEATHAPEQLSLTLKGRGGRLVTSTNKLKRLVVENTTASVSVEDGKNLQDVLCSASELSLSKLNLDRLRINGRSQVICNRVSVGHLVIARGTEVKLQIEPKAVKRLDVYGAEPHPPVPSIVFLPGTSFRLSAAEDIDFVVSKDATVELQREVQRVTIRGRGSVLASSLLRFISFEEEVTLSGAPHAQVLGASGSIKLGKVAKVTIVGGDSFAAASDRQTSQPRTAALEIKDYQSEDDETLTGVSLSNVQFTADSRGLQLISALQDDAQHVSPAITDRLPGLRNEDRRVTFGQLATGRADDLFASVYATALSELASSKGAPGSVRTRLNWCSYIMRSLTAPTRAERLILTFYRIIGFGERPVPAILAYLVASIFMTVIGLSDRPIQPTSEGLRVWFTTLIDWLATPFHILKLTTPPRGDSTFVQPWDTFSRILIAAPFATAFFALRKYVKTDSKSG
jgi:hypothetical protein